MSDLIKKRKKKELFIMFQHILNGSWFAQNIDQAASSVELYRTFLVRREFLCPVCFANQLFEYEIIKEFLQKNYKKMLNEQVYTLDDKLRKIQYELNVDTIKGNTYSKISKYLNQDYIFVLNQFLTSRLMEQQ